MSDKFRNCFIDQSDLYNYEIKWEGEVIAKAHTMSAKDKSKIESYAMRKKFVNGELEIDIDSHALKIATILAALDWWDSDRKLNEESVSMLPDPVADYIFNAIQAHEAEVAAKVEDTQKN